MHGIGAEIEDPHGWVWGLVESLDGTRSPEEAVAATARRHPGTDPELVATALDQLVRAGFLEDAGAPSPALSEREQERYSRGLGLYRWLDSEPRHSSWHAQLRLRAARVLVVGLGGTGSTLATALAASGVGQLHCVDFDTVELSNLNRQFLYTEADLGRPKAAVAAARLGDLNSDITVTGGIVRIDREADLSALLSDGPRYDLLALCADRPEQLRRWANRACLAAGLPWIDGGYRGPLAVAGLYRPGAGACWECLHTAGREGRDLGLPAGQDEPATPRLAWNPVNAVTSTLSGALMAHAAVAQLTGVPSWPAGVRFGLNLALPGEALLEHTEARPDCPACGRA